ncbi:hypothetical protein DIPPA_15441 [Diplonema papillatum]|nr:hypothetical protein DIPPA_15441 [Diplonema papillatum]
MSSVKRLCGVPVQLRPDYENLSRRVASRCLELGLHSVEQVREFPGDCSVSRYDKVTGGGAPWYAVHGVEKGVVYNIIAPQLPSAPGMVLVEYLTADASLAGILSAECGVVDKARQHIVVTYTASYANSDWRVSLGQLKANGNLKAMVVDVAYLPIDARKPLPIADEAVSEFISLLCLADEGFTLLWEHNPQQYALCGLPTHPDVVHEDVPHKHYAVDLLLLALATTKS